MFFFYYLNFGNLLLNLFIFKASVFLVKKCIFEIPKTCKTFSCRHNNGLTYADFVFLSGTKVKSKKKFRNV